MPVPSADRPVEPRPPGAARFEPDVVAARWRRGLARALDLAVVGAVLLSLSVLQLLRVLQDRADQIDPEPWGDVFVLQVVAFVLSAAVEVGFVTASQGQTPGRDRVGIAVRVAADGSVPRPGRALARWVVPGLAVLVPHVWPGVVVLAACGVPLVWGDRSLPDIVAGTRVVRYDRGQAGRARSAWRYGDRGGPGDVSPEGRGRGPV
jgi:uncharacterized RDD family membrane protein YckC